MIAGKKQMGRAPRKPGSARVTAVHTRCRGTFLVLVALLAGSAGEVLAQSRFTQEEIRALPRVCLAQKFVNTWLREPIVPEEERKMWAQTLGERDYSSFHHYCGGLIDMRRGAAARKAADRYSHYRRAVSNFRYVQNNASSGFVLMPQVNLQKGLALRLLGEDAAAAVEFQEAIELKPTYTPAYSALADVLADLGDLDSAKDLLARGLRLVPESRILASKMAEIEGRPPQPQ